MLRQLIINVDEYDSNVFSYTILLIKEPSKDQAKISYIQHLNANYASFR